MNFKDSIAAFENRRDDIAYSRGLKVRRNSPYEIMHRLSLVQSELSNTYRLYDVKADITLTGVQEYALETVLPQCLNIITLTYGVDEIEKVSMDEMNLITTDTAQPTKFTIYGVGTARKLKFDNSYTGTVTAYYYKRLNPYNTDDLTGAGSVPFDLTKTDYGGSWAIPVEFHPLIIEGAIANMFPDLLPLFYQHSKELISRKQVVFGKAKGFLGI